MSRKSWIFKSLLWLRIIQRVDNRGRLPLLGQGYKDAIRFNPWHPLSYPVVLVALLIFIGITVYTEIKETWSNPFKWN